MAEYRECLAITNIGNITAGGTVATQIVEASSSTGADVADISSRVATVAANVKVKALTVTCASAVPTDTISFVVDGTTHTFTGTTGDTVAASGTFASTGSDTVTAAGIALCANDTTLGFSDKAHITSDSAILTVQALDGYYLDSVAESGSFTTFATTKANSYVWFDSMDQTKTLPYVAAKITTGSNTGICSTVFIRGKKKGDISEKVGGQYPAAL